ncbi:MAG TPA: ATP-binding cassette domain-containing protein [Cytophagaceae bacterium]|jgi:phospholipid/cholesterol/gamma-HCH transport system ATP-binding protein|nr:ATP-binding cassette domain-containing protein [Cytophagaceae bacterium]
MAVVKIEHLKKSFGKNDVLKDMNLRIEPGENVVVLGKSGSGKSVLIKCLVRLIEPDDGTIVVFDKNMADLNEDELNQIRKKIGFLFQSAALYDSMTVRENLEFPLRVLKLKSQEERDNLVLEALRNVGLEEAIDKMPSELSGGMRKRIGLARTLILKPEIMLYDEPTTGLDPITAREISKLILDVQKKYNTASVIITHDIECARIAGNRLVIIKDGAPFAEGTYQQLSESKDEWVSSFFANK